MTSHRRCHLSDRDKNCRNRGTVRVEIRVSTGNKGKTLREWFCPAHADAMVIHGMGAFTDKRRNEGLKRRYLKWFDARRARLAARKTVG